MFQRGMSGMPDRSGPRDDLVQWLDAALTVRPLPWLELFARYQLVYSTSSDPSGRYHRNQFVGGLGVRWDFTRAFVAPRTPDRR